MQGRVASVRWLARRLCDFLDGLSQGQISHEAIAPENSQPLPVNVGTAEKSVKLLSGLSLSLSLSLSLFLSLTFIPFTPVLIFSYSLAALLYLLLFSIFIDCLYVSGKMLCGT